MHSPPKPPTPGGTGLRSLPRENPCLDDVGGDPEFIQDAKLMRQLNELGSYHQQQCIERCLVKIF
jgi:hypothetical protein